MAVGALQARLGLPPSTVSHHLAQLVRVKLVRQDRIGTTLVCHADLDLMLSMLDGLRAQCCADQAPRT